MLKQLKQTTLKSLRTAGVSAVVHNSRWRRERLLILAYHGISIDDESQWNSSEFMSPKVFRDRLRQLRDSQCNVLPLDEAISLLYQNQLPARAVVITFDDGTFDFLSHAFPIISEFQFPVTLYLTTFYSYYSRPIFDLMCSYLLYKGRSRVLDLSILIGNRTGLDLSRQRSRDFARREILRFAREQNLSAEEKDELLARLASQLFVDYDLLLERRLLQILKPAEVSQLSAAGVDVQLHTHRHRTPKQRDMFMREIEENRESIQAMTGKLASHFCYPSGFSQADFLPWLKEASVLSATTCDPGFASPRSNRFLLPRVLDNQSLTPIEFEGWLTGISAVLPRRRLQSAAA